MDAGQEQEQEQEERQWPLGSRLPNGAEVVTTVTATSGVANGNTYVLAMFRDDEYVTWALDPRTGGTFNGHYYGSNLSLAEAVGRLLERAGRAR